jgi:signal transduction histidine kinase
LHQLLIESGVALAIMALVSAALGWIVAGRVLRPLRVITGATRDISASNLHERLALGGPDDELKELGDTIDGLLKRLEASFSSQRQFVANASHELRTPLARQRTLAQVALSDPDASADSLRAAHERILASGEQQEQLIDALLTLSRVQAGAISRQSVDLAPLVSNLLAVRMAEAEVRGVRLIPMLAEAPLRGDPRLVERLVANVLDNALRHNVPGGMIVVRTGTRSGHGWLAVSNDGPLVEADQIERLYEPFERLGAERTNTGDGFGLGLCIVRAVATAHGASLMTEARSSGGLNIEVRFPPHPVPARDAPEAGPPPTAGKPSHRRRSRRAEGRAGIAPVGMSR